MSSNEIIVVDGANVAYEERGDTGKPRVSNIVAMRRALEELGYEPVVIIDASLKYDVDDQQQLETLIDGEIVRQVPAGTDADYFVIKTAEQHNARIVTNDRYRDYREEFPWIDKRRQPFMIIKGEVALYEEEQLEAEAGSHHDSKDEK